MPRKKKLSNTAIARRRSPRLSTPPDTSDTNTNNTSTDNNNNTDLVDTDNEEENSHGSNSEREEDSDNPDEDDQSQATNSQSSTSTENDNISNQSAETSDSETDPDQDDQLPTNTKDKTIVIDDSSRSSEDMSEEAEWTDNDEDADNVATQRDVEQATHKGELRWSDMTYAQAAKTSQNNKTQEIQFKQRRLAIMVNIPEVDNNVDRLSHLVTEVNEFLKFARKNNTKFRLRPFNSTDQPNAKDKNKWRTRMIPNDSSDFRNYCQGYYPFTQVRGGNYRLRINAVMDQKVSLPTLIENITHDWGHQDNRSISDLKSQHIHDPVKVGYLMRATRYITHSHEMVEALEWGAKQEGQSDLHFGISWGAIPSPTGGYDKDTSVPAVIIETNRNTYTGAVDLLKKWYPLNPNKAATPPYPGNFRFVINRDHPSVKGNSIAISNLSVLMERQGIFNMDTRAEQSFCLKGLDMSFQGNNKSIRQRLLEVTSTTSGPEWQGKPIFMSISKSINSRTGQKSSWFTFHKAVLAEAQSIVKNLPIFMKTEWEVDPEECCYAQFLNERDDWDLKNRVANNEDTDELAMATKEYTADLKRQETMTTPTTSDIQSMTSKAAREMQRMMGNDTETITSISKERQRKNNRKNPTDINIDASGSIGTMSGISAASTKTSVVRAKVHKEFKDKLQSQEQQISQLLEEKVNREQEALALRNEMAKMTAMLTALKTQITPSLPKPPEDESSQNSGENPQQSDTTKIPPTYYPSESSASETNGPNPEYDPEEDFDDDREREYQTHEDIEAQKEEAAYIRGEKYTRTEWNGPHPAHLPLPDSKEISDSEDSIKPITSPRKRIGITDSTEDDYQHNENEFRTSRSNREKKKRSTVTGNRDPGDHG